MKYILVTGGVIFGTVKGDVASSCGTLLKSMGFRVTAIKIDPYINIDDSLLSPFEHGEVFVLDDGGVVDLDLGNYERFLDIKLHRDNYITTGKIIQQVIEKERPGNFLDLNVQIIPHMTKAIQDWVIRVAQIQVNESNVDGEGSNKMATDGDAPEICIIELGGDISDIECRPFVEAFRQFAIRVGPENFCCVHVSLVPKPQAIAGPKTKPTEVSIRELQSLGLTPDLIICRSEEGFTDMIRQKISNYCKVDDIQVICLSDQKSIYRVPLELANQGLIGFFSKKFNLETRTVPEQGIRYKWRRLANQFDNLNKTITIALVGNYTKLEGAYASVIKALQHSALAINRKLIILYIEGSDLEDYTKKTDIQKYLKAWQSLVSAKGLIVPGGFGGRDIEGKILAIEHARKEKIPFLGVCLGFQCAVLELCRNVLNMKDAESVEQDKDAENPVVVEMPEHNGGDLGGNMRLGLRETQFVQKGGIMHQLYKGADKIYERHFNRYEVNPNVVPKLEEAGMMFVGKDTTLERVEVMELKDHPYFVGVQFHPEYNSRPLKPSPPYLGLLLAASDKLNSFLRKGTPIDKLADDWDDELSEDESDKAIFDSDEEGFTLLVSKTKEAKN